MCSLCYSAPREGEGRGGGREGRGKGGEGGSEGGKEVRKEGTKKKEDEQIEILTFVFQP